MIEKVTGSHFPKHMLDSHDLKSNEPWCSEEAVEGKSKLRWNPYANSSSQQKLKHMNAIHEFFDLNRDPSLLGADKIEQAVWYFGDLLKKMLVIDPSQRLNAKQLLKHEFFKIKIPSWLDSIDDDEFFDSLN